MAGVVATASSAPVFALPSGSSATSPWASRNGSSRITVGGLRSRGRSGARLLAERRDGFLGDSMLSAGDSSALFELGLGAQRTRRASRAQCVGGFPGNRAGGRVFFMPFGRGGGRGAFARSEWEKRQGAEQQKLREIVEREMKARTDAATNRSSYAFSLLRELEKRLRFEEEAAKKKKKDGREGDGESEQQEEPSAKAAEDNEGTAAGVGASTYELMKELEKRLRAERESEREAQVKDRGRRRSEREGRGFRTGDFESLYEYMRVWDREMREKRAMLEKEWRLREENRGNEGERRFRGQRWRNREDSAGRRRGGAAAEAEEKREEVEKDESSESTTTAVASASVDPEFTPSNATVVYLKNEANGAEIYLVGTSHVSQKSVDEVREVIDRVKPEFVLVELCRKRYEGMGRYAGQKDSPIAFVDQIVRMITNGNVGVVGKLMGIGLSSFYRLLSYRGYHPGREFQVAIEEGKKLGAKIVLGDQDIDTTLKHLGTFNLNMSVQDTFQFFGQRMPEDIAQSIGGNGASDEDMFERMRDRTVVRRFNEEMEKGAPSIYKALVSERNEVMVKALRNLQGKVVAVVGLAHMDGIEQLWQQANEKYLSGQSHAEDE